MNSLTNQTATTFHTSNGLEVFYRHWKTDVPKAIVVIVHGLNSHSAYYEDFAGELNAQHFDVFALDLRGRGKSEGEHYFIRFYTDVIDDIDDLIEIARSKNLTLPIFLFGHSAGGIFATLYAALNQGKLRGLISESLAFLLPAPAIALTIMKVLGYIIPNTQLVKLDNAHFSRDSAFVQRMNEDQLIANEKQPAKTMQQLLLATTYLKHAMSKIQLPTLILHGTADQATKYQGSEYLYKHISSSDKELKLYPGNYHDLLNDLGKDTVTQDVISWIKTRI